MAEKITITIATADKAKKAQVSLPGDTSIGALIETCKKNWTLPASEDFAIRDPKQNLQLSSKQTLESAGIATGAELEVYPLLEAGNEQ